ncbi:tellurite resistance TerB family protein [Loktanella sp. DJP18]|uniref:tellurite resistance TerB family protein n=1 Tax=Loktanella sp. DJP18 TaxID=3409788 RepID=UPI003BB52055
MNVQKLLEQFLGPDATASLGGDRLAGRAGLATRQQGSLAGQSGDSIGDLLRSAIGGGGSSAQRGGGLGVPGAAMGGLAAGGLLGMVLGGKKKKRKKGFGGGGMLSHGGAAVLGALAHRAYQNWQDGQQVAQASMATLDDVPQDGSRFAPVIGADGKPFALALIGSMIAAANADGHIDADEQNVIFDAADRGGLDAEGKAFIFDAIKRPPSPTQIAALAADREQAAELYLAARVAINPDEPTEMAFLHNLSQALDLPADLVNHLDTQVASNLEG